MEVREGVEIQAGKVVVRVLHNLQRMFVIIPALKAVLAVQAALAAQVAVVRVAMEGLQ